MPKTRRSPWPSVGIASLILAALCGLVYSVTDGYVMHQVQTRVHDVILQVRAFHEYVQHDMHPALYRLKGEGRLPREFFAPEILSSSYITRGIQEHFGELRAEEGLPEIRYRMAAADPRNPINQADAHELTLIERFRADPELTAISQVEEIDGEKYFLYAKPFLRVQSRCLMCHGAPEDAPAELAAYYHWTGGYNYEEGDVVAVETFRSPLRGEFKVSTLVLGGFSVMALIGLILFAANARLRFTVASRTKALEESTRRLRSVLDASKDVSFVVAEGTGDEARIVEFSPGAQRIFGYSDDEIVGKPISILFEDIATDHSGFGGESTLLRASGEKFPALFTTYALPAGPDDAPRFLGVAVDITKQKRAEDERRRMDGELQEAQRLESLSLLAGGVAHDFNNLLTCILGYADLSLETGATDEMDRESFHQIKTASQRAANLARQMLAYSGRGKLQTEPVNLSKLLEDMGEVLRVAVAPASTLKLELADGLPSLMADPNQLRQVAMSLVTNAAEAIGPAGGVVTVSTAVESVPPTSEIPSAPGVPRPTGRCVVLRVTDNGCGMDEGTRGKIFEPFFSTKFTGRGLGLAAALGIVRGHDGGITVDSAPGRGSTFTVLFPVTQLAAATPTPAHSSRSLDALIGSVLLVDDDEQVLGIASRMLERLGLTVITAIDGPEALSVYEDRAADIDCVILDFTMPRMNGGEVFRALKELDPRVRVILSSGYAEEDTTADLDGDQLDGYIQKPYTLNKLSSALRDAMMRGQDAGPGASNP